jgi:hypothetical protein
MNLTKERAQMNKNDCKFRGNYKRVKDINQTELKKNYLKFSLKKKYWL